MVPFAELVESRDLSIRLTDLASLVPGTLRINSKFAGVGKGARCLGTAELRDQETADTDRLVSKMKNNT
jgi:hypothetical protein